MRKNSIKNIRINQEVQKELSMLISREVKDPRISPLTSVVSVEVAPDLKTAKVYISVLGDAEAQENTIKGLKSASPFLRSQLAHTLNMRNTPELIFRVDQSIEYGVTMSHYIDEVASDIPERDEEGFIIENTSDKKSDDEDEE
ncbi:MAG: 30S ribosome-binding factor RbfA [Lachnospiraceae bacterium]|nr:30S ribosome-binding factor RbfA [Lachnospiraceae bacterium]